MEFTFMKDIASKNPEPKQIYFDGYFKGKVRPTYDSSEVKYLVAEQILTDVVRWYNSDENDQAYGLNIEQELLKVISYHKDGYSMAKELDEEYGWDSDSDLVEILDNLDFYNVKSKLTMLWIKDNGINPYFKLGDIVKVNANHVGGGCCSKQVYIGEIYSIGHVDGTYGIFIEALGHVRKGTGVHGSLVAWEKIDKLNRGLYHE